jgi:transcriptional regulator with XRE-family HTH domain
VASISEKVGDLGDYLREQREAAKLSVRQLSLLAGVSNPYLSQIERGLRKPSAEVLQQLAKGLRISAEALYVRAGILDGEGRPDVELAIGSDPTLNERQRRALLDIYASFRAENERARTAVATTAAETAETAETVPVAKPAARRVPVKRAARKATTTPDAPAKGVARRVAKRTTKEAAANTTNETTKVTAKRAAKRAVQQPAAPAPSPELEP